MKITPLTIDFDVTNAQEVEFVNELMNRLFGSAPLKAMAAPTESPVNSTSVPTFSEPTQTAAPVQEVKEEPKQTAAPVQEVKEEPKQETITEAIAEAIAEVKKEMKKPGNVAKPRNVAKPKAVKEAPQATIEPEPVQAPTEEEKAPEKASKEPLTAKDMQAFMIDLMKSGKITRPQLTDIMLEFGGASLMRIKPEKYELLKQRIETYND
jgi:outer membrane biosynthesis protein TonB